MKTRPHIAQALISIIENSKDSLREGEVTKNLVIIPLVVVALMTAVIWSMAPKPKIELTTYSSSQEVLSDRVRSAALVDLSVGHQESKGVILNLQGLTVNGKLQQKGDCRSNGSICIFFGSDEDPQLTIPRANFAILYVFGSHMKFAVVSAPLLDANGNGRVTQIADTGKYYDPKSLVWTCAWILAGNGSGSKKLTPPESQWLNVGEGWAAWGVISQRYNLVVPIMEIPLPPMPPGL